MKNLIILVITAFAGWYAYHHWQDIVHPMPKHDIVVENTGTAAITRLRVRVAGQTFVRESLLGGASATWHFVTNEDSDFDLTWEWSDRIGESHWKGGSVVKGPIVQVHRFRIDGDGGVVQTTTNKLPTNS